MPGIQVRLRRPPSPGPLCPASASFKPLMQESLGWPGRARPWRSKTEGSPMTEHYDAFETREPAMREADLLSRLPQVLRRAMAAPAYAERLKGSDHANI